MLNLSQESVRSKEKVLNIPQWILDSNTELLDRFSSTDLGNIENKVNQVIKQSHLSSKIPINSNDFEQVTKFLNKPLLSINLADIKKFEIEKNVNNLINIYLEIKKVDKEVDLSDLSDLKTAIDTLLIKAKFAEVLIKIDEYFKSDFAVLLSEQNYNFNNKGESIYLLNKTEDLQSEIRALNKELNVFWSRDCTFILDENQFSLATKDIAKRGVAYFEDKIKTTLNPFSISYNRGAGWYQSLFENAKIAEVDLGDIQFESVEKYMNDAKERTIKKIEKYFESLSPEIIKNPERRSLLVNKFANSLKVWGYTMVKHLEKYHTNEQTKNLNLERAVNLVKEFKLWDTEGKIADKLSILMDCLVSELILAKIGGKDKEEFIGSTLRSVTESFNNPQYASKESLFRTQIQNDILQPIKESLSKSKNLPDDVIVALETSLDSLHKNVSNLSQESQYTIAQIMIKIGRVDSLKTFEVEMQDQSILNQTFDEVEDSSSNFKYRVPRSILLANQVILDRFSSYPIIDIPEVCTMVEKLDLNLGYYPDSVDEFLTEMVRISSQELLNQDEIKTDDIDYLNDIIKDCRTIQNLSAEEIAVLDKLDLFTAKFKMNKVVQGLLSGISSLSQANALFDTSQTENPINIIELNLFLLRNNHNLDFILGQSYNNLLLQKARDGVEYFLKKSHTAKNPLELEAFKEDVNSVAVGFYPSLLKNLSLARINNPDIPKIEDLTANAAKRIVTSFKNQFKDVDIRNLDSFEKREKIYNKLKDFIKENGIPPKPFLEFSLRRDINTIINRLSSWDTSNEIKDILVILKNTIIGHLLYTIVNRKIRYLGNTDYSLKGLLDIASTVDDDIQKRKFKSRIYDDVKSIIKILKELKPVVIPQDLQNDLSDIISKIKKTDFLIAHWSDLIIDLENLLNNAKP